MRNSRSWVVIWVRLLMVSGGRERLGGWGRSWSRAALLPEVFAGHSCDEGDAASHVQDDLLDDGFVGIEDGHELREGDGHGRCDGQQHRHEGDRVPESSGRRGGAGGALFGRISLATISGRLLGLDERVAGRRHHEARGVYSGAKTKQKGQVLNFSILISRPRARDPCGCLTSQHHANPTPSPTDAS